jgi:rubrerythrin
MLNMKEIAERIQKTNDQRVKMAFTLLNVMQQTGQSSLALRSAVAESMVEMLQSSMIKEDNDLIKILNEGIDGVCKQAKEEYGIEDYRSRLQETIDFASKVVGEHTQRVNEGDEILSKVNFNDINLN